MWLPYCEYMHAFGGSTAALHNPNLLKAYLNISCKVIFLIYHWSAGKKQKVLCGKNRLQQQKPCHLLKQISVLSFLAWCVSHVDWEDSDILKIQNRGHNSCWSFRERNLMYGMYFASELALKHLLKKLALKALINKSHICNDTVYFELRLQETFFFNGWLMLLVDKNMVQCSLRSLY